MLPASLRRSETDLSEIRKIAGSENDFPALMLNVNRYRPDGGFPSQEPYLSYISGLEALVNSLGGRILWRLPVLGQPVGQHRQAHEVLAIWYPSHQAYLDLPDAPGGTENYELRLRCVEEAVIHRCSGTEIRP